MAIKNIRKAVPQVHDVLNNGEIVAATLEVGPAAKTGRRMRINVKAGPVLFVPARLTTTGRYLTTTIKRQHHYLSLFVTMRPRHLIHMRPGRVEQIAIFCIKRAVLISSGA